MNIVINCDMTKKAPDLPFMPLISAHFSASCDAKNLKIE